MIAYVPIPYSAWFDSKYNTTNGFLYLSNESLMAYKRWYNETKINLKWTA